jgi:hypothetical protein
MQDMQRHLEKLRLQLAECEKIRELATDPAKRDLFASLADHLKILAAQVEHAMAGRAASDTFLGRRTHDPFPKEDD